MVRLQVSEALAFAAQLVGVNAHPALAGVEQRRPGFLGAREFCVGDLFVANDEFPFDEGVLAELLFAVVGRCGCGFA